MLKDIPQCFVVRGGSIASSVVDLLKNGLVSRMET